MNINILPSFPNSTKVLTDANEIEAVRQEIAERSEALRLDQDRHPRRTANRITRLAGRLTLSNATAFETSMTLAAAAGNLRAAHLDNHVVKDLAEMAIDAAHPPSRDPMVNTINAETRAIQRAAISLVDSDHSYAIALSEAQAAADEIAGRDFEHDVIEQIEKFDHIRAERDIDELRMSQSQAKAERISEAKQEDLDESDADTVPVDMSALLFDDEEEAIEHRSKAA